MALTARADFLPADQWAYADQDRALPIGHDQTSSQPRTVRNMLPPSTWGRGCRCSTSVRGRGGQGHGLELRLRPQRPRLARVHVSTVHPFWSHGHLDFGGGDTPHGGICFDIALNAGLSVTVAWAASEIDDEVEATIHGGTNVGKDAWISWSHLRVNNDDSIDNDWTTMNVMIHNDQG